MAAMRGPRVRQSLFAALLLLGLCGALAGAPAHAADDEWQTLATTYFTLYYPPGTTDTAQRYAAVVDDLYAYVAAVFEHGPAAPVPLRLYPDSAAYARANPIARYVEGVLAHADPRRGEIGIAVDRVDRTNPSTLRDTVRHELMHLAAIELSSDRLPIGFQEGLAQYAEKEASDRRRLVSSLEQADRQGRLLTWDALNDQRRFLGRMNVAYPESLSVMSFLLDRYGLGTFQKYLVALGQSDAPYWETLENTYGHSVGELEMEWREYLPTYIASRWDQNLLRGLDLTDARARFAAGEYAAARPLFEESQRLFAELDRTERLAEARGYLERIALALSAEEHATQGRAALAARDYAQARVLLVEADAQYAAAGDTKGRPTLAVPLDDAERGARAGEQLAAAHALVAGWRYPESRVHSREAAALYLTLGDQTGFQQAETLRADAETAQRRLALLLLAAGGLVLAGMGVRYVLRPRPARPRAVPSEGITL